jgi:hypothetical protein
VKYGASFAPISTELRVLLQLACFAMYPSLPTRDALCDMAGRSGTPRPPIVPRTSSSPGPSRSVQGPGTGQTSGRRRESLVDRLKKAASQPSLAGLPSALGVPSIVKAAEALVSRSEGSASSSRGPSSSGGLGDAAPETALLVTSSTEWVPAQ